MIVPTMRYENAREAIGFLCRAFGFTEHMIIPGEGDAIAHAELTLGRDMIMLGSAADNEYGRYVATPLKAGTTTQGAYIVVADADAHHARAVEQGARIVVPLTSEPYGRMYSCLDPQGHIWSFGTYDPWAVDATSSQSA